MVVRYIKLAVGIMIIAGATASVVVVLQRDSGHQASNSTASNLSTEAFLKSHWSHPIPPQGPVPKGVAEPLASLDPRNCGSCHVQQWEDWSTSKHSQAMGKGLLWQLPILGQAEGNRCLRCHAPLAEQKALQALRLGWENAPKAPPPEDVPDDLEQRGLVCASCHLRRRQLFGPPPRPGSSDAVAHQGLTRNPAFGDSLFCATCHQFPEDGPRVNGKLQEDAYQQWLESPAAARGEQCQHCHMPDRRHLWRGIHDPEMVRSAVGLELRLGPDEGGPRKLHAVLKNVGAGHYLPTYMVPKLLFKATLKRDNAEELVVFEKRIGWFVDANLQEERFDTRIPPGEQIEMDIPLQGFMPEPGDRLIVSIDVQPREHYERMFIETLRNPKTKGRLKKDVQEALDEAREAHYTLMQKVIELVPSQAGASAVAGAPGS